MRLYSIYEDVNPNVAIVRYDQDSYDYDTNIAADQADQVAKNSGIRISRDKELLYIALVGDAVVGAVWSSLYEDPDNPGVFVFDFDVAVEPKFRSPRPEYQIGIKLIEAALQEYRYHRSEHPTYIRVWVVNPKLVRFLERQYGFEIEAEHGDGSAHMVYHGKTRP